MKTSPLVVNIALIFSLVVPILGYISLGLLPAAIFLIGFLGGFLFWHSTLHYNSYDSIKYMYWIVFALFIIHRIEEKVYGFFPALSKITGVPVPEIISIPVIAMVLMSVGAWIVAPFLIKKGNSFGYYLAWTLFISTGVSELAHFIFPLFAYKHYSYFPGMYSVLILAPVSWYTVYRWVK